MSLVTQFFNKFLQPFFEPVTDEFLNFGFNDGLVVKDLVIKPEGINQILKTQGVDARVDHGHVGSMKLVWTALPGIVTLQIRDLDIRLKPNLSAFAAKEISKKWEELQQPDEEEELPLQFAPYYVSDYPQRIHDTTATKAPHNKIPPPPPVVRHAQYLPRPPVYFGQQPLSASAAFPSYPNYYYPSPVLPPRVMQRPPAPNYSLVPPPLTARYPPPCSPYRAPSFCPSTHSSQRGFYVGR